MVKAGSLSLKHRPALSVTKYFLSYTLLLAIYVLRLLIVFRFEALNRQVKDISAFQQTLIKSIVIMTFYHTAVAKCQSLYHVKEKISVRLSSKCCNGHALWFKVMRTPISLGRV